MALQKIHFATDHAGFELKEFLKEKITQEYPNVEIQDHGAYEIEKTDDYTDYVIECAKALSSELKDQLDESVKAIVIGGSGQGEAIAANRIKGVRCAIAFPPYEKIVPLSREHNNANALSLGARFITKEDAWEYVQMWLTTPFSKAPRHIRRIQELDDLV